MLKIIKWIIVLAVLFFVVRYVMNFFNYDFNREFFLYSQKRCENNLKACLDKFAGKADENSMCNFKCVNPSLIIKKK
jgi:hypothetical protein